MNIFTKTKDANTKKGEKKQEKKQDKWWRSIPNQSNIKRWFKKNQKIKLSQLKLTYQTCNIDHKIKITP